MKKYLTTHAFRSNNPDYAVYRDVIVCDRGAVSLVQDESGIVQAWDYEPTAPTERQVEEGFIMMRVILGRLLGGVGTMGARLAIAERYQRQAVEAGPDVVIYAGAGAFRRVFNEVSG